MREDIKKMLLEEAMILHRAGYTYHPPMLDENNKMRMVYSSRDPFIEIDARF